jgi:hypothetical protein
MPRGLYKRASRDPNDRFDEKYVVKETGCWEWIGSLNAGGYGTFHMPKKPELAHRFSYQRTHGRIKEGLELDHLCRNRRCVNPDHLEQVTRRENTVRGAGPEKLRERQRAISDQRTEKCANGHSYLERAPYFDTEGHRHCRECKMESQRRIRGQR